MLRYDFILQNLSCWYFTQSASFCVVQFRIIHVPVNMSHVAATSAERCKPCSDGTAHTGA